MQLALGCFAYSFESFNLFICRHQRKYLGSKCVKEREGKEDGGKFKKNI